MGVAGDRMGSNANAWQKWSHIPPCLFSLSDWITEDQILVDLDSHMPALFWEMSRESSICQPAAGPSEEVLYQVPYGVSVSLSVLVLPETCGIVGNLGRLEKAGMSPFKGAASSSWRTLLLLQEVTNHRKKELAQGRMLGGPMREKGRDLGKGRALGSCKMPLPPGHLVLGIRHFTFSVLWSLQFPELPIPRTPDNHPSPHSYGGLY